MVKCLSERFWKRHRNLLAANTEPSLDSYPFLRPGSMIGKLSWPVKGLQVSLMPPKTDDVRLQEFLQEVHDETGMLTVESTSRRYPFSFKAGDGDTCILFDKSGGCASSSKQALARGNPSQCIAEGGGSDARWCVDAVSCEH